MKIAQFNKPWQYRFVCLLHYLWVVPVHSSTRYFIYQGSGSSTITKTVRYCLKLLWFHTEYWSSWKDKLKTSERFNWSQCGNGKILKKNKVITIMKILDKLINSAVSLIQRHFYKSWAGIEISHRFNREVINLSLSLLKRGNRSRDIQIILLSQLSSVETA